MTPATPIDINKYWALVTDSATTAIELRRLVEMVDGLMQNSAQFSNFVDALAESQQAVVDRAFLQAIALIFIFFLARRLIEN